VNSMKNRVFYVGGAVFLGISLIFISLYMTSKDIAYSDPIEESASTKNLLAGGNAISDWEETLRNRIHQDIMNSTSTLSFDFENKDYTPPTTLTGKFSEAFLQDYLEGKIDGKDFSNPDAFINSAVRAIERAVQSKKHTRAELTIVPSTQAVVHAYGNEIVNIMNRHYTPSDPEHVILEEALSKNDPAILAKLKPIELGYDRIIQDTLRVQVPNTFALAHIDLLNAYEAIYTDVVSMQLVFNDPLVALARINSYPDDAEALFQSLKNISSLLDTYSVIYTANEPGTFFYIFDAV